MERETGGPSPGPPAGSLAACQNVEAVSTLTQEHVAGIIKRAAAAAPRSQQVELGPSEAGEPCTRRLAYKILDWHKPGRDMDPWAPVQGTAVHAWLAAAFTAENTRLGRERYLVERRVQPVSDAEARQAGLPPGHLAGSADLFDRDTGTVTDWKLCGEDRIREYAVNGPGGRYRAQAHLYGLGMVNAGERVRAVSVAFLPRAASLAGMHIWSEPFDPAVAHAAMRRAAAVRDALIALDPETNPGRWEMFPTAAGSCRFCPWLKPGSRYLAGGCPGHLDAKPASVTSLIA